MVDWGRIGSGIVTGGLSEAYYNAPDGAKQWLTGGGQTEGMASGPATGAYQTDYLKGMLGRPAPMMDPSQQLQGRQQQMQLANLLRAQASGQVAGAGELAVNRQVGQAQAQQTAQASMARGANAALAGRTAARNTMDIGVAGAGQAAQAQMQDQTNAQGQLGSILNGMRGQDIGVAGANQQAQMQQQQIQLNALAHMLGIDVATLQQDLAKRGIQMQDKGMLPDLLQAGGTIGAAAAGNPGPAVKAAAAGA